MENIKLIVLCVFAGFGILAFLCPAFANLLVKFYDIGKQKK